jgi:MFS family permease
MNHFHQLLLPVLLPQITAEYGLSNFVAGVLLSCFSLSYSLLQTPVGYFSRMFGRKNLLALGLFVTSFSFLIMGFVDNVLILALLSVLAGVGGSTHHPNGMPLISELFKEKMGQASGFHQTGGSLGSFIGPLVTGFVAMALNWRLALIVLSAPGFVLAFILWSFLLEPKSSSADIAEDKAKASRELYRPVLFLIGAAAIYTVGLRGVNSFASQYFDKGRGIANLGEASFLFSMLQVAGLFSGPFSGRLSDRLGRRSVLVALIVLQLVSLYSLIAAPVELLIVPCLFFGFASFGMLAITDAYLIDITPRQYIETVFGLHYTASFTVGAIVPPILGLIIDLYGFNRGLSILGLIVPLGIIPLTRIKQRKNVP